MNLEELKKYLNITDNSKDFIIWERYKEALQFIFSYTWDLNFKDNLEKVFMNKTWKIFIPDFSLKIKKIEKNIWNFYKPAYKTVENYRFLNWCLYLAEYWEIRVFYSTGYQTLPEDVKTAIKLYLKDKFLFEVWKIKTEIVDMDRVDFELDKSTEDKIFSLISKYKIYDFSA